MHLPYRMYRRQLAVHRLVSALASAPGADALTVAVDDCGIVAEMSTAETWLNKLKLLG